MLRNCLVAGALIGLGSAAAPVSAAFVAVAIYDENVFQTNTVDASATAYTVADMTADAAAAHAVGRGGVINFDNGTLASPGTVVANYGLQGDKTITLSSSDLNSEGNPAFAASLGTGGSRTPISGNADGSWMLNVAGVMDVNLALSGSGLEPGEFVQTIGFTVLSRSTSPDFPRLGTLTVNYSDGSTGSVDFSYAGAAGTNDTFVGFTAPVGLGITSFTLDLNRDANPQAGSSFTSIDDFGFVTNIPEPAALSLLAVGGLALLRRRNR